MFLIFIGIIFFAIIIMAFCTPPSDNKDTTKKDISTKLNKLESTVYKFYKL